MKSMTPHGITGLERVNYLLLFASCVTFGNDVQPHGSTGPAQVTWKKQARTYYKYVVYEAS
jgi:hypothetical protein